MKEMIAWDEARDILLDAVGVTSEEMVDITHGLNRVLARDIKAPVDVPPFDKSPFDGYALRSEDTVGELPVTLRITQEIPAGYEPGIPVEPGCAAKILTGAPIPEGADAVIKFEQTEFTASNVTINKALKPDTDIIHAGEDIARGETIARAGDVLDPGLVGSLASLGIGETAVRKIPTVAVITTGSELADITGAADKTPPCGKIFNSNRYSFMAALEKAGAKGVFMGACPDDISSIASMVSEALDKYDAVLTTGGVSVGDYDFTMRAYEAAGADILCGNIMLKPGGKSCYAAKDGKLIFGLSGNPASAMTAFYSVVMPALLKLQGRDHIIPSFDAKLKYDCSKKSSRPRFIRGRVYIEGGKPVFEESEHQGNGGLLGMAGFNALALTGPKDKPLMAGDTVTVYYYG